MVATLFLSRRFHITASYCTLAWLRSKDSKFRVSCVSDYTTRVSEGSDPIATYKPVPLAGFEPASFSLGGRQSSTDVQRHVHTGTGALRIPDYFSKQVCVTN